MESNLIQKSPKILILDIETKPALAYVWRLFDETISLDQLIEPSAPICFGAKFYGEKEVFFYSDWEDGHDKMVMKAWELLNEADAVVTYNGDKFDIPKLRGEFLLAGLPPPPPLTSIDLLKSVKKLGLQSNKLAFVGPFFDIGQKVQNEGFKLWKSVLNDDKDSQGRMKEYCVGDILLTEELYDFVLPYINNHPHLGEHRHECGNCGSENVQSRGTRRTRNFKIQRLQCQDCGAWSDGTRTKV